MSLWETIVRLYRIGRTGRALSYLQKNAIRTGDADYIRASGVFVFAHGVWMRKEYFLLTGRHIEDDEYMGEQ